MMVISRSVLTTFLVVGTSSSVLALPFQSFAGTGLPQNDVASTATTQAMPSIPTGYVQGQSVGVQEDAVKNHNGASNSPSPSGLASRISMDARTLDNKKRSEEKSALQKHLELLGKLGKTTQTPRPLPVAPGKGLEMEPGPKSNKGDSASSGSGQQTRRDLFDTRNVDIIESPTESSEQNSFVPGSTPSPSTSDVARETDGKPTHHGQNPSHPPSSPTGLPLANDHRNTRSIYGEDLD
ncbi:hypothetical protein F5050DRAFT_1895034 [Lentinula boryana]|uniref:Uncharacterized protein n=1 Tax=Lentinula boryana TaxID=40481 RepID=A0ABQ8QD56_9AGAR|nr:hypothetical protein F5050DRAFT_1895034 [Lentinula boryana]